MVLLLASLRERNDFTIRCVGNKCERAGRTTLNFYYGIFTSEVDPVHPRSPLIVQFRWGIVPFGKFSFKIYDFVG